MSRSKVSPTRYTPDIEDGNRYPHKRRADLSPSHVCRSNFPRRYSGCAYAVAEVGVRREELVLAPGARSHGRDFVLVLQDDEAAFHARTIRLNQPPVGTLQDVRRCTYKVYV